MESQRPLLTSAGSLEDRLQRLREDVQRTRSALDHAASGSAPGEAARPESARSSVVTVPEIAVKSGALYMEGKPVENVHQKARLLAWPLRGANLGRTTAN